MIPDLRRELAGFHTALDKALDIEAGLRDIHLPDHRVPLDQMLDAVLNVDAGLAAILSPRSDHSAAESALYRYVDQVTVLPTAERLAVRRQLPSRELEALRWLADFGRNLSGIVNMLNASMDRSAIYAAANIDKLLADAPDSVRAFKHMCTTALSSVVDAATRRDIGQFHVVGQLLMDELSYLTSDLSSWLPDHEIARALERDRARIKWPAQEDFDAYATDINAVLATCADFVGADLTDVDLTGIELAGLQWSPATQWPPAWAKLIQLASDEIEEDRYEVRDEPSIYSRH